jgi:multicomponent Na+:H+ antiporter subunit E
VLRKLGLAIVLFILWILLSGIYQPFLISLGIVSSLFVAWIAHRMDVVDHEGFPIHLGPKAITYWPWLLWEIVKANIDVALIIVKPKLEISPVMFRSPASQNTEVGLVTYANSITLTPGTITVALNDGSVDVHSLTVEAADEVISGRMDKRVCQMEGIS